MIMKKNIEKQHKDGRMPTFLKVVLFLIFIYIVYTFAFYINEEIIHFYGDLILHLLAGKPLLYYAPKWICALILFMAIMDLNRNTNFYYSIINGASMGVLSMLPINFAFYQSYIDFFLLETIAVSLIIYTNQKWFIEEYRIKRSLPLLILFGILSLLIALVLFFDIFNFI